MHGSGPHAPNIAVILDINTPSLSQWSVLAGVGGERLSLFDSNGMRNIAVASAQAFIAIRTTEQVD